MRHYTTNENHGEDILKAIAKIEALENNFKYSQKEADEFVIGFFDWFNSKEAEDLMHDLVIVGEVDINTTTKELLEIYKKEKGL